RARIHEGHCTSEIRVAICAQHRRACGAMEPTPSLFRQVSALAPIAMSTLALVILVVALAAGAAHEPDEGTGAHLFQLLIAGQAPIVAYFALKWLPREPTRALQVLGLQFLAAAAPIGALALSGL